MFSHLVAEIFSQSSAITARTHLQPVGIVVFVRPSEVTSLSLSLCVLASGRRLAPPSLHAGLIRPGCWGSICTWFGELGAWCWAPRQMASAVVDVTGFVRVERFLFFFCRWNQPSPLYLSSPTCSSRPSSQTPRCPPRIGMNDCFVCIRAV
jgi:hypothetical protein